MNKLYSFWFRALPVLVFLFLFHFKSEAQSFSQTSINFNGKGTVSNGTSLTFGPDGRLYVTEYVGVIKIFTVERNGPGDYIVTNMEELKGIQSIQDHNDDGSLHSSTMRETIGIVVVGTAANPIVYVSSSDFRIGGGGSGGSGDVGLDTNSGIITRFSWNGSSWDVVDIVRGLPRSEENHATNGLDFATVNGEDYLIVAQGGHTNAGGPSTNFAYTTEYALSAAVLSVNLTQLEAMPILDDNGRKYIYDLPTLDDPTRPNVNGITDPDAPGYDGIDVNDPFGGNDGLNQAMIVPGGPVQIFSPGYRNAYDLVVTEKGAVYVTDNGANGGWGGFPVNEGGGNANNDYDPNEPGSSKATADGEKINNKDHLTLVTLDIQNYVFGSFYGGHPTPVRANPLGAGLYTNPSVTGTEGAVFRTLIYHPNKNTDGFTSDPNIGLPANWPPVSYSNPDEGDYRGPGDANPDGPVDQLVTIWGTNTNGIAEYTASNFEGAMKGNLIAGVNTGDLRRVELNEDGSLKNLTPSFASGLGGDALGVTCNGDSQVFPGTIWVVTLNGKLVILEPQDFGICLQPGDEGFDPLADYDFDGYTNQDELDNGTDHCNGGSQPKDFDKAAGGILVSDLNDTDDDNDGIPDAEDPFQMGDPLTAGSDAFPLPVYNELFSSNPDLKGYMGLGMTGLMNNGDPNPNWLNWLDRRDDPNDPNPNDILGGAIGAMTMQMTAGTAYGITNSQEKGFQYGVQVNKNTGTYTVAGGFANFNDPLQLYGNTSAPNGELGIFMGDGSQSNYIKFVLTQAGITVQQEINDVPQDPLQVSISLENRPLSGAAFYFIVDPATGIIELKYSFDSGPRVSIGTVTAEGAVLDAIQLENIDLAVGFSGTSNASGVEVEGTWDFLHVTGEKPYVVQQLPDLVRYTGAVEETIDLHNYFGDDKGTENLLYSVVQNTDTLVGASIQNNLLTLKFPATTAISNITIAAVDAELNTVEQTFKVEVREEPPSQVLYRVNAGGSAITSIDTEMDWSADSSAENSPYLTEAGGNNTGSYSMNSYTADVDQTTTPTGIFNSERSDNASGVPNVTYSFPATTAGNYEIRLYMGNGYHGTSNEGQRLFDIMIEGIVYQELDNIDLSGSFGHKVGGVIKKIVEVTDGSINISLLHGSVENPLINGIEILGPSGGDTPINVTQVPDQFNVAGEELDGSLVVNATGGDGNLKYSMTGAPAGVSIEPTNGQIGGKIDSGAATASPYTTLVTVDDGDEKTADAVTTSFTWTITTGEPFIVKVLPDLERTVGAVSEDINLNYYFGDNKGVENLVYLVAQNTDTLVKAKVLDSILTLGYPSVSAISDITVRATDTESNHVEQSFRVTVSEKNTSLVLYRINAGGPAIVSIDSEIDWGADTAAENSPYLMEAGGNNTGSYSMNSYTSEVDQTTTPVSIFNSERSDNAAGEPNITYSFPVETSGLYEIRLYMGNGYHKTSNAGQRIFDVEIEGVIHQEYDDIDLSGSFGHKVGAVISKIVEVTDGSLDISFLHGAVENPLLNGIEILKASGGETPIEVATISDQLNFAGELLDGSLIASATGGDGVLSYAISGAPKGVIIDPATGVINGTIDPGAYNSSPYSVTVTVDDDDEQVSDSTAISFTWTVAPVWTDKQENENYTARHECSFVQAGDKFYLIGGREKAKTVDIFDFSTNTWTSLTDSAPFEFNHYQATEYQGLIWVIGAFKDNAYPSEVPAENIWIFDPSSSQWIMGPEIPVERRRGSASLVVYNDKFYVTGGNTLGHKGGYIPWFDEYDPATGTWTILTDAPRARDHFHSAVIGNKLYAVGGRLSGGADGTFKPVIAEVDVYDFATATWSSLPASENLPTPRAAASVVNFRDKLLVIGGEVDGEPVYGVETKGALKITEEYDPVKAVWSRQADLNYPRHGTQAIVSGEGVFTLAGSPVLGGGSQKNMEYLAKDAPSGTALISSTLSFPDTLTVSVDSIANFEIKVITGNVGIIIKGMEITGTNAENFAIVSGSLSNALLKAGSGHNISVDFKGIQNGETAKLNIAYGASGQAVINLTSGITENAIQIYAISDQSNVTGDTLDGSLLVSATGGDGALVYSMTGAPAGIGIDASIGTISGTIAQDADIASPYTVVVTVDDSDEISSDAVTTSFTWTVTNGQPYITTPLPDLERTTEAASEDILLDNYFGDNKGVENLVYTLTQNTDTNVGAAIINNVLTLTYPAVPAVSDISVRATDADSKFVEQTFRVTVTEEKVSSILYRVNAGGPAITAIDGAIDWGEDTSTNKSPYLTEAGGNNTGGYSMKSYTAEVDLNTTPTSVFNSERSDHFSGMPNLTYSFPVAASGYYEVRLYVGNGYHKTSKAGQRIYDIEIEGTVYPETDNVDLSGTFGHKVGAVIKRTVEVSDGTLNVSFIHGSVENPLVNGIEILGSSGNAVENLIKVTQVSDQNNVTGDTLDGSLQVSATGGDGALVYSMTGAPAGINIDAASGAISGTIAQDADIASPYTVMVTVDDSDEVNSDAVTTTFTWTVTNGEPYITTALPDLERTTGAANEDILLDNHFGDNNGVGNLVFTVTQNTDTSIGAAIVNNILTLTYPSVPAVSDITIQATDADSKFVEETFKVTVTEATASSVLYRVNTGGPAITAIDGEMDWGADTSTNKSPYLTEAGGNNTGGYSMKSYTAEVDLNTTPTSIFNSERSDHFSGVPNITYSFPVTASGYYEVRLYVGNGYHKTSKAGQRIFDVEIEGVVYPETDNVDLSGTFGHKIGAVIKKIIEVTDGTLNVSFVHGSIENPLINGIEILKSSGSTDSTVKTAESTEATDQKTAVGISDVSASQTEEKEETEEMSVFTVKLYPNPAVDDAFLQASDPSAIIHTLGLYDYNGRFIKNFYEGVDLYEAGQRNYRFNVSGLPNGVYILKVLTNQYSPYTLRLLKDR